MISKRTGRPAWAGWLLFLTVLLTARPAFAARAGVIDTDGTEVREGPGSQYKTLDKLPKGSSVAASNQPIDGYYKVRTSAGVIGFVNSDSLVLQPLPPSSDDAPTPPPSAPNTAPAVPASPSDTARPTLTTETNFRNKTQRKFVRIKALGGYNFFNVSDVNNLLNANVLQFGYSLGGEIDFMFTQDLAFVIRVEKVFKNVIAQDSKTNKVFAIGVSSYPVMAGLNLALTSGTHWSSHVAVMAGLGLQTDLTAVDSVDPSPNVTEMSQTTFTGVGVIDLTYSFNRTWSCFAEAGYRYLQTSQIIPGTATSANGAGIFLTPNTSTFTPVTLNLSGPFLSLGVAASF